MRWVLLAMALLSCAHPPPPRATEPTGIAAFTDFSRFVDAKVSPKGSYLAAIRTDGGKRSLWFIDLVNRKQASVFRPLPRSVGRFEWVNDSRVVVELLDEYGPLAAPVSYGELYAVDAAAGRGQLIFGYGYFGMERKTASSRVSAPAFGFLLARLPRDDRRILIVTADARDVGNRTLTILKLDAYSGLTSQVTTSPIAETDFLTDENGEPRIAIGRGVDAKPRYFYRDPEQSWRELLNLKGVTPDSEPRGFASGTRTIYLAEPREKGFGLYSVSLDSGERTVISKNEWVPPDRLLTDDHTQQVFAVRYDPDVTSYDILVPDHPGARVLQGLLDAYPDETVRIVNTTDDAKLAVAFVHSDRDPGRFLLVDTAKLAAEEVAAARPWIKPQAMADMTAFHIPASDGMWIHGYVTLPKPSGAPLPMVVIPHGGPHEVRDYWRFDSEAQLLASEGLAVLQVNYRGSGGYGRAYQEAGYGHWGDRIVQDILDATRYAVRKGYADGQRICIYGGSFGAYAAMQAAILAPDLFRCAVGVAGVYDLTLMAKSGDVPQTRLGRGYLHTVLGDDPDSLKKVSPAWNADKLKAKVLLIHGNKDQRAPIEHAERLRDALTAAGAPPQWLVEPHEGHGFYDEGAREKMYTRLLEFLRENTARPKPD